MKWLMSLVVACFLLCTKAHAQTTATYDFGRAFSVAEGAFVLAHVPGVEWSKGLVTASAVAYFGPGGLFEKDLTLSVSRELKGKWTVGVYGGAYWYTGIGRDWSWSVNVRRVIR